MASIQLGDFTMNVEVHPGLAPMDTVFIHGNLASNTWWEPSLELWKRHAKPSYEGRFIMAEWRGCGQSGHVTSEDQLKMETMANDYVSMMRAMDIQKANLVAHSTGGLLSVLAMLQAPSLFERAVLLDPVGARGVKFPKEMFEVFTNMSKDRDLCSQVMHGTIHGNNPENPLFKKIVDDAFGIGSLNWHGIPRALAEINIVDQLPRIQQPVLVLQGEHDPIILKSESVALAEGLPNGKFMELNGQGHSANVENPELFVRLVNEFLFPQ